MLFGERFWSVILKLKFRKLWAFPPNSRNWRGHDYFHSDYTKMRSAMLLTRRDTRKPNTKAGSENPEPSSGHTMKTVTEMNNATLHTFGLLFENQLLLFTGNDKFLIFLF